MDEFTTITARLHLRALTAQDWPALQRMGETPEIAPMMASITSPWPKRAVRDWIKASQFTGRPGFRLGIVLHDGPLIGVVGLGRLPGESPLTAMYFIAPECGGKGYATEAMTGFLNACFARFDMPEIEAEVLADNPASARVLEKLGFLPSSESRRMSAARGRADASVRYRLTRANWHSNSPHPTPQA